MIFRPLDWLRKFYKLPETRELAWEKTKIYQKRLEQVKTGWIVAGLIMLAFDNNALAASLSIFCLFLSFAFLEPDDQFSK